MPTKIRTDKVAESISPLVTRVTQDDELRAHAKTALDSAKAIVPASNRRRRPSSRTARRGPFGVWRSRRVGNSPPGMDDGPRKAATNKAVTDEVVRAAAEIRATAEHLTGKTKRKSHKLRTLILGAMVAGAAAVGLKKVLHRDEDEFDYES